MPNEQGWVGHEIEPKDEDWLINVLFNHGSIVTWNKSRSRDWPSLNIIEAWIPIFKRTPPEPELPPLFLGGEKIEIVETTAGWDVSWNPKEDQFAGIPDFSLGHDGYFPTEVVARKAVKELMESFTVEGSPKLPQVSDTAVSSAVICQQLIDGLVTWQECLEKLEEILPNYKLAKSESADLDAILEMEEEPEGDGTDEAEHVRKAEKIRKMFSSLERAAFYPKRNFDSKEYLENAKKNGPVLNQKLKEAISPESGELPRIKLGDHYLNFFHQEDDGWGIDYDFGEILITSNGWYNTREKAFETARKVFNSVQITSGGITELSKSKELPVCRGCSEPATSIGMINGWVKCPMHKEVLKCVSELHEQLTKAEIRHGSLGATYTNAQDGIRILRKQNEALEEQLASATEAIGKVLHWDANPHLYNAHLGPLRDHRANYPTPKIEEKEG